MAVVLCSLLPQALCFHHFNILNEPLAFEDMKICGLGFKLDFK
jgi:hypothetical protein